MIEARDASPENLNASGSTEEARAWTLSLLARRASDATICPSEVARAVAAASGKTDWRPEMPAVHAAIKAMNAEGLIRVSWKGEPRQVGEGPYRIGKRDEGRPS